MFDHVKYCYDYVGESIKQNKNHNLRDVSHFLVYLPDGINPSMFYLFILFSLPLWDLPLLNYIQILQTCYMLRDSK